MAIASIFTATLLGVDAYVIEVESDVSIGLGSFNIVGLPDHAIKESRDRITSALNHAMGGFPIRKVVVNLAPADIKKSGTGFDLPISLAILEANKQIPKNCLNNFLCVGELSLEGRLRPVPGILAIILGTKKKGIQNVIVPQENGNEAALVKGIQVFTANTLQEVTSFLLGEYSLKKVEYIEPRLETSITSDFNEVCGQETAKRALEVVAAGKHNILFTGPPGSGKTMLAKRLPSILPSLNSEEILEVTKIHSISRNISEQNIIQSPPFRNPHHTISSAGLIGGGSIPKPGEVSLAHKGVLFLDEFPEFSKHILEMMRQPLEDKEVHISRARIALRFPTDFLLIAAMNPCPCGYHMSTEHTCRCTPQQIHKYQSRISGPLLDRIDLQIEMPYLKYQELVNNKKGESSYNIRKRVLIAREIQAKRFKASKTDYNGNMNRKEMEKYCVLNSECQALLDHAMKKFHFSIRTYDRILKVTRTIADLDQTENIQEDHLAEAIQYRLS